MPENAHFRIEKAFPRVPSSAGYFFDFQGGWRLSGFCGPYKCLHGP